MPVNKVEAISSPRSLTARERLIVALDVPKAAAARALVLRLGKAAVTYKVGLQLFTAEGPDIVRELVGSGHKVFLDLKLHDIPNTVRHAVRSAAALGASMLTVHAAGGSEMLRAAVEAAEGGMAILGVTVLTNFTEQDLHDSGVERDINDQVLRLASLAHKSGCAGVVASARETAVVRKAFPQGFTIVNPGIRPHGADKDDQQRVATPAAAIVSGATYIVVGRPITLAEDPAKAADNIVQEMEQSQHSICA
jgi:orotidine-5'-phosphate decarboxylase